MKVKETFNVDDLLREQLIDLSLKHGMKELFMTMTGDDWRKSIILGEYHSTNPKELDKTNLLEEIFYEKAEASYSSWRKYVEETTITDFFEEKERRLAQLKDLSKHLNHSIHTLVSDVLKNEKMIKQLTFVSDKTFRNGVFYMDGESDKVLLKEERENIKKLSISEALNFYLENEETFYLEIKARNRNAKKYNL